MDMDMDVVRMTSKAIDNLLDEADIMHENVKMQPDIGRMTTGTTMPSNGISRISTSTLLWDYALPSSDTLSLSSRYGSSIMSPTSPDSWAENSLYSGSPASLFASAHPPTMSRTVSWWDMEPRFVQKCPSPARKTEGAQSEQPVRRARAFVSEISPIALPLRDSQSTQPMRRTRPFASEITPISLPFSHRTEETQPVRRARAFASEITPISLPFSHRTDESAQPVRRARAFASEITPIRFPVSGRDGIRTRTSPPLSLDTLVESPSNLAATTFMLRNIPNKYTRHMLVAEINERGFAKKFDFLYLPLDFQCGRNFGYAFINLVSGDFVADFMRLFHGQKMTQESSTKVCQVAPAKVQGQVANANQYRNSGVMNMPESFQPLFLKDGKQIPFPMSPIEEEA